MAVARQSKLREKDHHRFERLIEEGEGTTARAGKRRRAALHKLAAEIAVHERNEEELYPADVPVAELKALDPADERRGAQVTVLGRDRLEDLGLRMQEMNGGRGKPSR